jgi:hypothetical protein
MADNDFSVTLGFNPLTGGNRDPEDKSRPTIEDGHQENGPRETEPAPVGRIFAGTLSK